MLLSRSKARKYVVAVLASGTVFLVLVCMLWSQAVQTEKDKTYQSTERLRDYTDMLLREAKQAAGNTNNISLSSCSEAERNQLNRIEARYPHLRSVNLIRNDVVWCSSLTGHTIHALDLSELNRVGLMLHYHTGSKPLYDSPLLTLAVPAHNGRIDVVIRGVFIQNFMSALKLSQPVYLMVGDTVFDSLGRLSPASGVISENYFALPSSEFPFSVISSVSSRLTVKQFAHAYIFPLLISLLFSLLPGWGCLRWSWYKNSPYHELLRAIKKGEILTIYQPVIYADTGKIAGFEALCRWQQPSGAMISPDIFIPAAEQNEGIIPLTQYQIRQITRDMKKIAEVLEHPFYISINFSREHFAASAFISDCQQFIQEATPLQIQMVVEITERTPLELTADLSEKLNWLRNSGVQIALDDFGTGYSNLSYIETIKPDWLKIDKMFISHMENGNTVLLDTVIDMAKKLNIHVIAEGIETPFQSQYLVKHDIACQQGFYWFHPMNLITLLTMLKKRQRHEN